LSLRTLRTKDVDKFEKHFLYSVTFFEYNAVYEIVWKNTVQRGRPQMKIWRMRIAFWIPKATNTHSEYVILIPFPRQQWLHEFASVLYVHCLACFSYSVRMMCRYPAEVTLPSKRTRPAVKPRNLAGQ
jgi:hypothetical protein